MLKIKAVVVLLGLSFGSGVFAQDEAVQAVTSEKPIVGVVRDAKTKLPIPAAIVRVPLSSSSALTDENGQFSILVNSSKSILRVSAYDYNQREIAILNRDSVVVDLYSEDFSNYFKTIQIATGGYEQSILTSSSKSLNAVGKMGTVAADEELQTQLGGDVRSVSRSGVSGEGASLFIRGLNSINLNAQPLYVVDGVVWNNMYEIGSIHSGFYSNPIDNIDLNDVESVTVMKDGTSLYGSKASNGVILINTKRAKSMATRINLHVLHGIVDQPKVLPMMNGEEFRTYASDMFGSKGLSGSELAELDFLNTNSSDPIYNTFHNSTKWSDLIYRKALHKSYSINATGGDDKAMYYFSIGYTGNDELVKSTDYQRTNTRFNADFSLNEVFDLGLNIGFSRSERKLLDDGVNYYSSPSWIGMLKSPFLSPYNFTSQGEVNKEYAATDIFNVGNPLGIIKYAVNNQKKFRFNIGFEPKYRISPELSFSTLFDYSMDKIVEGHFDPFTFTPVRELEGLGLSYNKTSSQEMKNSAIYNDSRLSFEKSFNKLNRVTAVLGWRYINNSLESDYLEEHNSKSNSKTTITGDYEFLQSHGLNNQTKSISTYFCGGYNFDNRYLLDLSVAVDGSSRFGNNTEGGFQMFGYSWGVFPSVNAGWLISSEEFMTHLPMISYLKLRAGYGLTGNDGIMDYESLAYFTPISLMGRANGIVIENVSNNKIQWETTSRANLGLDIALFNDRAWFTLDGFYSVTSDLLSVKDLPDVTGLGQYWANGGEMKNLGLEFSATVKALNLKNWKWELGMNLGHYQNEITSLPNGGFTTNVFEGQVLTAVGNAAGVFYGFKTNGVFSTGSDAELADLKIKNQNGSFTSFAAGDIRFVEKAGAVDGVIDDNDRQVIGDPNPDFYGSFSSKLTFKRLSLSTVVTYSYGNDIYNYYRSQLEAGRDISNQSSAMVARWTADGQRTMQPKSVYGDPMGNGRFSDRWIEDGSYIRLKNITLSYQLPLKSKYLQGISVWASANNLVTLTKYLGMDPEVSVGNSVFYQGIDAGYTPVTRSYFFGVNFNL